MLTNFIQDTTSLQDRLLQDSYRQALGTLNRKEVAALHGGREVSMTRYGYAAELKID